MAVLKFEILILDQNTVTLSGNEVNSESLDGPDLEQPGEHVESEDGAGAVRVGQQLADVAAPGFLLVLAGRRLEGGDDGRQEWRRQRRRLHFWRTILLFLVLTVNTDHRDRDAVLGEQTQFLGILLFNMRYSHECTANRTV